MSDSIQNESQPVNNSAPINESSSPSNAAQNVATSSNPDSGTASIVHLLAIFTSFVGPLVMYLIYKDKPETSAFLKSHIMSCLNFQLVSGLTILVLTFTFILSFLTIFIWPVVVIIEVLALIAASQSKEYKYPIDIQLVK